MTRPTADLDFTTGAPVHGDLDVAWIHDFLIMNGLYKGYLAGLMARGLWAKISRRVS